MKLSRSDVYELGVPVCPAFIEGNPHLITILAFWAEDGAETVVERCASKDKFALAAEDIQPVDLQLNWVE